MLMDDLFTILFDPTFTGKYQFFDRTYHTEPSQLLKRVNELNRNSLFVKYRLFRVSFEEYKSEKYD